MELKEIANKCENVNNDISSMNKEKENILADKSNSIHLLNQELKSLNDRI